MNDLCAVAGVHEDSFFGGFPREDWVQFAQLIGYSVSAWSTLSYVSDEDYSAARSLHEGDGETSDGARSDALRSKLEELKEALRVPMASLFEVHPDDLR